MNSRRSFFSKITAIAASLVLAPEIAFGVRLKLGEASHVITTDEQVNHTNTYWNQTDRYSSCYDAEYLRKLIKM
jgi:hypothetical protein